MIEKTKGELYKTSDGEVFTSEEQAIKHELYMWLDDCLDFSIIGVHNTQIAINEIIRKRKEVYHILSTKADAQSNIPLFQSAVTGLWYENPLAAGDISAIKYDNILIDLSENPEK